MHKLAILPCLVVFFLSIGCGGADPASTQAQEDTLESIDADGGPDAGGCGACGWRRGHDSPKRLAGRTFVSRDRLDALVFHDARTFELSAAPACTRGRPACALPTRTRTGTFSMPDDHAIALAFDDGDPPETLLVQEKCDGAERLVDHAKKLALYGQE